MIASPVVGVSQLSLQTWRLWSHKHAAKKLLKYVAHLAAVNLPIYLNLDIKKTLAVDTSMVDSYLEGEPGASHAKVQLPPSAISFRAEKRAVPDGNASESRRQVDTGEGQGEETESDNEVQPLRALLQEREAHDRTREQLVRSQ